MSAKHVLRQLSDPQEAQKETFLSSSRFRKHFIQISSGVCMCTVPGIALLRVFLRPVAMVRFPIGASRSLIFLSGASIPT
ncbi:hypothetical protein BJX64DRAFT_259093 [Aspergillus heterothallicus]